jgi:hypothetical protein
METPIKTIVHNITDTSKNYMWIKKPGLQLDPKQSKTVDYDVFSLAQGLHKQMLLADLENKRVALTYIVHNPADPEKPITIKLNQDGKPEVKEEPKPEPKPEVKPEVKPEPKEEVKPEPKEEVKPEPKEEVKPAKDTTREDDLKTEHENAMENFKDVISENSIEDQKPPVESFFGEEWEGRSQRREDLEAVDLFPDPLATTSDDYVAPKASEQAAKDAEHTKRSEAAKKAAITRKRNAADKAAKEQVAKEAKALEVANEMANALESSIVKPVAVAKPKPAAKPKAKAVAKPKAKAKAKPKAKAKAKAKSVPGDK